MICHSFSKIHIPGTEVIPVPLYRVLDGKRSDDYVARVEPSAVGGRRMAEFLYRLATQDTNMKPTAPEDVTPPSYRSMEDR